MNSPSSPSATDRRIFLVDDHPLMREGIATLINQRPGLEVCGEATSAAEAFERIPALKPDLILLDLSLPDKGGLELLKDLNALCPEIPVLVLSMHDELLYAERVLRAGGRGYLKKDSAPKRLIAAIDTILRGGMALSEAIAAHILGSISGRRDSQAGSSLDRLTDRQLEVFELIGRGEGQLEIATKLHISPRTVDAHCAQIREKLALPNTPSLLRFAVRWVETGSTDFVLEASLESQSITGETDRASSAGVRS